MSVFDNSAKDDLEYEVRTFLEEHTIIELLEVVKYCIETKEDDYIEKINALRGNENGNDD